MPVKLAGAWTPELAGEAETLEPQIARNPETLILPFWDVESKAMCIRLREYI